MFRTQSDKDGCRKQEDEYGFRLPDYRSEILYGDTHAADKRQECEERCHERFAIYEEPRSDKAKDHTCWCEQRHHALQPFVGGYEILFDS